MAGMNIVATFVRFAGQDVSPQGSQVSRVHEAASGHLILYRGRQNCDKPRSQRARSHGQRSRAMCTISARKHLGVVLGCNGYDVVDMGVMVPADRF